MHLYGALTQVRGRRVVLTVSIGAVVSFALAASALADDVPRFRVIDLGVLTEQEEAASRAFGLNNHGEVVGESIAAGGETHGFVWLPGKAYGLGVGLFDLNALPAEALQGPSTARDINNFGEVAGQARSGQAAHAFVWQLDESGVPTFDLGTLSADPAAESIAHAINDVSPPGVVGASHAGSADDGPIYGFFDVLGDEMFMLPPLGRGCSVAHDINSNMADYFEVTVGVSRDGPCVFEDGPCDTPRNGSVYGFRALFRLRGGDRDYNISGAFGTNAFNQFVGWTTPRVPVGCDVRAAFWADPNADPELLPGGSGGSRALAINDPGGFIEVQAVGGNPDISQVLLWERDPERVWHTTDLNEAISSSCGWELVEAQDINDTSWIVGSGLHHDQQRAYLLTPVGDCPADVNGDEQVNFGDLLGVLSAWGDCLDGVICTSDANVDCTVDFADVQTVLAEWGVCAGD